MNWNRYSHVIIIYIFLLLLIVFASFLDEVFFTLQNFKNLLIVALPLILAAFAQTIIILTSGIDLSVGAIISLANVICAAVMTNEPWGFLKGVLIALIAGILTGAFNGFIVSKGRIQPIIVTLATSAIYGGLALMILPRPGGTVHVGFARTLTGSILGISIPLIILILTSILIWTITRKTPFGFSLYAIGGNELAAFSTGVAVDKIKFFAYTLAGFLCSLAGIFLAAQMYSGDPTVGNSFTMNSITSVVVGGTILAGGKGGIIGSIAGAYIIVIINNILNLVGVSSFYQYIFQGSILIIALAISSIKQRGIKE
jgi:ribose transport system permease protein